MLASPNNRLAKMVARLGNLWAAAEQDFKLGQIEAVGIGLALWKTILQRDIRNVVIGTSLRRIISRAISMRVDRLLYVLVGRHQLGVRKRGAEIGVHAMRHIMRKCDRTSEVGGKADCRNAFPSVDRQLYADVTEALMPQLTAYTFWQYGGPTEVLLGPEEQAIS